MLQKQWHNTCSHSSLTGWPNQRTLHQRYYCRSTTAFRCFWSDVSARSLVSQHHNVSCAILGNGWMAKGSVKWSQASAKVYCTIWGQRWENWRQCNCSRQSDAPSAVWNNFGECVGILQFERKANIQCFCLPKHGSTTGASFPHQLAKCSTHKFFRQNKPGAPKNAH